MIIYEEVCRRSNCPAIVASDAIINGFPEAEEANRAFVQNAKVPGGTRQGGIASDTARELASMESEKPSRQENIIV
jgi:hypothetical protein